MELPVYRLVINPDDETGVDFVSLVTSPAIERDFVYFGKGVKLELPDYTIEGLPLFHNQADAEAYAVKIGCSGSHKMGDKYMPCKAAQVHKVDFAIQNEEKRIIFGMAMEADKKIYRYDEMRGEYYVYFDAETIFEIAKKWAIGDRYDKVNVHHGGETKGLSLFESYIVNREMGKFPPTGYEAVADGSWFLSYIVNDQAIWDKVKSGEFKGFSVEGYFDFEESDEERQLNAIMNAVKQAAKKWNGKN